MSLTFVGSNRGVKTRGFAVRRPDEREASVTPVERDASFTLVDR
jgi:hypothetical protein